MDHPTELLGIGEFARASGLTPKALRLYDESGLLSPAEVDGATGYRRYAAGQLDRARRVSRMRLAGMPLARIRAVVDSPPAAAAAELTSYWRQVEADTGTARRIVADLLVELAPQETDMTSTDLTLTHPAPAVRTGVGRRDSQEDAVLAVEGRYAVADGVGDARGLAEVVLADLASAAPDPGRPADPVTALDAAVARSRETVARRYADQPRAGTTLTVLELHGDQVVLAHLGDSRAYLVREGRLERLTRDHSVVQTLVDEGRLTAEEARVDDRRVQLNRAVAVSEVCPPDLAVRTAQPGDRYVLTTDGVHAVLDPADLTALLTADTGTDQVADAVAAAVEAAGAPDNYAVLVLDLPA